MDSGASISLVRYEVVLQTNEVIHKQPIHINGLGGRLQTEGFVYLDLSFNGIQLNHKFHVLKQFPCETDGIIGRDFFQLFLCNIDYENNTVTLNTQNHRFSVPLQMGNLGKNNFMIIPPRCEKIFYIDSCMENECLVLPKELCEGVFLASSITKPRDRKIAIQVLNTRDDTVNLSYFQPEIENLSNYSICKFDSSEIGVDRVRKVLNSLDLKHLNKEERTGIQNICAKFSDIFYVPGDKLTTYIKYVRANYSVKTQFRPGICKAIPASFFTAWRNGQTS